MSHFFTNKVCSFEELRVRSSKFASDRDWGQFHTPTNITLALSGECGEVCEIFQFKGDMDAFDLDNLKSSEVVHAGEKIADVLVYLTLTCPLVCSRKSKVALSMK